MATRRRSSRRSRVSASVIDLTCDLDSDSDNEVLIVGEEAAPPPRVPSPPPVDIVGMHMVVEPDPQQITPAPPPPAATDYPRNHAETLLETELSDLAIDLNVLQGYARERGSRSPRPGLELHLRELQQTHSRLAARVGQLQASRRRRFEALVRPLSADLDEARRLLGAAPWQQRDGGGPVRARRGSAVPDLPPPPPPDSPSSAGPSSAAAAAAASAATAATAAAAAAAHAAATFAKNYAAATAQQVDRSPPSPTPSGSGGLQCPVCWESVYSLKEQQRGFLVTRCGHWFCEPCLKGACRVSRRECPVCRTKLGRPPYRPLYL